MYNKILVPLDGSKLAEVALTHLDKIAKERQNVLLVSVTEAIKVSLSGKALPEFVFEQPTEPPRPTTGGFQAGVIYSSAGSGAQQIPKTMGKMGRAAIDYLSKKADELEKKSYKVIVSVLYGNPAEEIVKYAEAQLADLIIIGSRGKSGFSRWEMGNIADKVLRATKIPVMLIKPDAGFKETKPRRRGTAA